MEGDDVEANRLLDEVLAATTEVNTRLASFRSH
jgi:hypothetical protein